MADNEKKGEANWLERGISFALGFLTGGATAVTVGAATNSIRTADEREAANAAEKLQAGAKK